MFGLLHHQSISMAGMLQHNLTHMRDLFIGEAVIFLVCCGLYLEFLRRLKASGSLRFRIRGDTPRPPQMWREFFNSTRAFVIYNASQLVMRAGILMFGLVLTFDKPTIPLWLQLMSFPLIIVVHDAHFYWFHWVMHKPALFRLMHWEHHRSRNPTVFAAHSFAVGESLGHALFPIFYVVFFPCTFATLIFFYVVMIAHDVAIHAGVELFPPLLVTDKRFGWLCGTVHHDIHHAVGTTNYGLYFRFWDRLMKTEHPEFERIYAYVRSPANDGRAYRLLSRRGAGEAVADAEPIPALEPAGFG